MKLKGALFLVAAPGLLFVDLDANAAGPLRSVSAADRTNISAAGNSFTPVFSADGRFVVFVSHANNLATNDDVAPYLDVFVRDLASSNTVLVSVNMTGGGGGNADANYPSISSNGQFVAFASAASNLVKNDTNDAADIFVRDLISGVTTVVSVDATGTSTAATLSPWTRDRLSINPLISADGRWVIFESLATNLVAVADTNKVMDIFARDLVLNKTLLVSINAQGTGTGNGKSELPSITPDGRFVAFVSTSTDLVPGVTNQLGDIYIRDLVSGATILASTNMAGFFTNSYRCFNPVLSSDGRALALKANSPSEPARVLLIHRDLQVGIQNS